jgi:hypothetical protein
MCSVGDGRTTGRRRADHQAWLREQQRQIDEWNHGRPAREARRRLAAERHWARPRRSLRGIWVQIFILVASLALEIGLLWGAVHGIERVASGVSAREFSHTQGHADLDLREVLALLSAWRS